MPSPDVAISNRLYRQLRHIVRTVPYYRDFGICGEAREALTQLPVVTKATIKGAYGDFISDDFAEIKSSLVRYLCAPTDPASFAGDEIGPHGVVVGMTSGSTGVPFRCPKSMADRMRLGKGIWSQRSKVDPFVSPSSLYQFAHRSFPVTSAFEPWRDDPDHILALYEDLSKSESRWLHTTPQILLRHIAILESRGARPSLPKLRFIECSGLFLTPKTKVRLQEYFGVKVVDQYGTMETWTISLSCRHGVHHINDQNVIVEILDENDAPATVGVTGRIVVTCLHTNLLPLIRYVTNDFGRLVPKRCDCELGEETIEIIEGRDSELIGGLTTPTSGTRLFNRAISKVLFNIGHCDLKYIRIFQTDVNEFLMKSNEIANGETFRNHLRKEVSKSLGRPVQLRHILASGEEMLAEERRKPCLFRRDKPLRWRAGTGEFEPASPDR